MSKWTQNILFFVSGAIVGPLVWQFVLVPLWNWSNETGPALIDNAAGLILFALILLLTAAVFFFLMKMAQQNRRKKRIQSNQEDGNVSTINGDDPKLIKAEEHVARKTSSA